MTLTYQESLQSAQVFDLPDLGKLNPLSQTILLEHGRPTEHVILFLHGYTNSPYQFVQLGNEFFQRGYNVFIPRAPFHGFQNRLSPDHRKLTSAILLDYLRQSLSIAHGLGEKVTVAGLSMGGVLSLWAGQFLPGIYQAIGISPALAFYVIPLPLTPFVAALLPYITNRMNWWDPIHKDAPRPPLHAYPQYSYRALMHILRIGLRVRSASRTLVPLAEDLLLIFNPTDESVNPTYARYMISRWQALGAKNVRTYEFDPNLNLRHDLIDPTQPHQQIATVYPILLDLIIR